MTVYLALAMWFAFLGGGMTNTVIDAHKHRQPIEEVTIYKIGVDLHGNTASQCEEYHGPAFDELTR